MNTPTGRLALWNDCAPGQEPAYEAWYQGQHLPERVGIPGFVRGRRYRALGAGPTYFTYYETKSPSVLQSTAYLDRVNNPTPETSQIMATTFTNMSRTICRVDQVRGYYRGSVALTWTVPIGEGQALMEQIADMATPALARAELWEAIPDNTQPNAEQALRGPDHQITEAVMAEFLDEDAARTLANRLGTAPAGHPGIYQLMCELQA